MESGKQLANRLREVMINGTWIARTNYKDQLSQITWQQAITKVSDLNTLAALTFHINYYLAGVCDFFEGSELTIRDAHSFDMEPIDSESGWLLLRDSLFENSERFAGHVEGFSTEQLDAFFVKEAYGTYRRNIEAQIEHAYYHLGQVSLIRKMLIRSTVHS